MVYIVVAVHFEVSSQVERMVLIGRASSGGLGLAELGMKLISYSAGSRITCPLRHS